MGSLTAPGSLIIGGAVVAGTAGSVLFVGTGPVLAQSSKLTLPQPDVAGQGPTITAGIAVTAVSPLAITQTWNAAGVTFPGLTLTITDTASAAGSLGLSILGGAGGVTNLISVGKTGIVTAGLSYKISASNVTMDTSGVSIEDNSRITSVSTDWSISRIAANVVGIGTGAAGSFAGRLKLTSAIVAGTTIANLNGAPTIGERATVTDALAPALGVAVAAGGAAQAAVWWNGANWTVTGI